MNLDSQQSINQSEKTNPTTNKKTQTVSDHFILALNNTTLQTDKFLEDQSQENRFTYETKDEKESDYETTQKKSPEIKQSFLSKINEKISWLISSNNSETTQPESINDDTTYQNQHNQLINQSITAFLLNIPLPKALNKSTISDLKKLISDIEIQIKQKEGCHNISLKLPPNIYDLIKEHLPDLKKHLKQGVLKNQEFEIQIELEKPKTEPNSFQAYTLKKDNLSSN